MQRRKGETIEDFRKRDATRKRKARQKKGLNIDPKPLVHAVKVPEVMEAVKDVPSPDGIEPVKELYGEIGRAVGALREAPDASASQQLHILCSSFQRLASGLKTMQTLATRDEVRHIVELVHPHLPRDTRLELRRLLDRIDARAGVTS